MYCKNCPDCPTCTPTNVGAACRPKPSMSAYARAVEQDRLFTQEMLKNMTPEQINHFCFENGFTTPSQLNEV